MKPRNDSISRISSVLTGIISLIVAICIPVGYFIIAYQYMEGSINAELLLTTQSVEELVSKNPKSWQYQEVRLREILEKRLDYGTREKRAIRNKRERLVAETTETLTGPVLRFSEPVHDVDEKVATIEITRSIFPLILQTGLISASSALTGILIFLFFRSFPLRAVREAYYKMEEREQRLSLALKVGHFGVWDWDIKKNVMIWDERTYDIYGISRDSMTVSPDTWINCIHPEDRDRVLEDVRPEVVEEKRFDIEFRIVRPDETVRDIRANGILILDGDGKQSRIVCLNCDITERKLMEDTLSKNEIYS